MGRLPEGGGGDESSAFGFWPYNTKLGPAKAVGIFGMSSGPFGLCIAAKGTDYEGRKGVGSWFPVSYNNVKLATMMTPNVTARAFGNFVRHQMHRQGKLPSLLKRIRSQTQNLLVLTRVARFLQ